LGGDRRILAQTAGVDAAFVAATGDFSGRSIAEPAKSLEVVCRRSVDRLLLTARIVGAAAVRSIFASPLLESGRVISAER
jgi:hypothetical protein